LGLVSLQVGRRSWSYVSGDSFMNASELLGQLCDIVSKGGNFLLDVPPHADGSFDANVTSLLLDIGAWLGVHGAAIFKTRPWAVFGEGPTKIVPGGFHEWPMFTEDDFRFTAAGSGRAVFLFLMKWVEHRSYSVTSLNSTSKGAAGVTDVSLIGSTLSVDWKQDGSGLHLGPIPASGVHSPFLPVVLRVHLGGASADDIDAPTRRLRKNIMRP